VQVVILAGGLGTRMQRLTGSLPKAMLPVSGKPFVERQLVLLSAQGLRDIVICTGYGSRIIESHLGDGAKWGVRIQYSREDETHLLGTGGALVNALPMLETGFFVIYGDSYLMTDFLAVAEWNRAAGWPAVMCVYRNEGRLLPSNVAVVEQRVSRYDKSCDAGCDYIDYGLSWYSRTIIERYRTHPLPLDLGRVQSELAGEGSLGAFTVADRFYEVGSPTGLAELEAALAASERTA